jgi:peroxiredoxin
MRILASDNKSDLPQVSLVDEEGNLSSFNDGIKDNTVLLFTATWCDWYLADTRPQMSQACIEGQKSFSQLYAKHPKLSFQGIVSHLWTESKELKNYAQKYGIEHPFSIDESGDTFFAYGVRQFPTMIILKEGEEVYRTSELANSADLSQAILRYLN